MISKKISVLFAAIVISGTGAMMAIAGGGHDAAAEGEHAPLGGRAVAQAYIAGMEAADLDALNTLFIADDQSSILENASDEGSWEHYRDHHLGPEMEVVKDFQFEIASESEEPFGDAVLVKQIGTFSFDVRGEMLHYRVAISYLMTEEDGHLRIAHLHWSSKPNVQKDKDQDGH